MSRLTIEQQSYLLFRRIKIGSWESLPRDGAHIHEEPNSLSNSIFLKLHSSQVLLFEVKGLENGFYRLNMAEISKQRPKDFFIEKSQFENRATGEWIILSLVLYVPFVLWNLITK